MSTPRQQSEQVGQNGRRTAPPGQGLRTPEHRQHLLNQGFTDAEIDRGIEDGFYNQIQ